MPALWSPAVARRGSSPGVGNEVGQGAARLGSYPRAAGGLSLELDGCPVSAVGGRRPGAGSTAWSWPG